MQANISSLADSMDVPDPPSLSLFLSLYLSLSLSFSSTGHTIHSSRCVIQTTSCVHTELKYTSSCKYANSVTAICWGPLQNVTNKFVLASSAESQRSFSSYLDLFQDGRLVVVQLFFSSVLLLGLVKNCK